MNKIQLVHIRIPYNMIQKLDKLALEISESRSTLVRRAISEYIEKLAKEKTNE